MAVACRISHHEGEPDCPQAPRGSDNAKPGEIERIHKEVLKFERIDRSDARVDRRPVARATTQAAANKPAELTMGLVLRRASASRSSMSSNHWSSARGSLTIEDIAEFLRELVRFIGLAYLFDSRVKPFAEH
jgi:hypothetical protein